MSTPKKINIEKRVFNLGNNETFLLEYPSNYEEIANKKTSKLQQEYESVSNNIIKNNINIDYNQNEAKEEKSNKEIIKANNNTNLNDNKSKDNNYYQPIGNVEIFSMDDKINDNDHNNNGINNNNDNMHLEPNEGIINIKNNQKEKINSNEKVSEKENEEDEFNNEEFYEVEEKEIPDNNNNNRKEEKEIENNEKINKKNLSPVKNPENIKLSMKLLNFKAPKWAENLADKDFINMAKNIISSKKNIP